MKSFIMTVLRLTLSFNLVGCGGGNKQKNNISGTGLSPDTNQSSDRNQSSDGQAVVNEPGPFSEGEFGEIKLSSDYDSVKADLEGALLLDIRTAWEREHIGYPKPFTENIAYQNRDYKMVDGKPKYENKPLNPDFVTDVTALVNGNLHKKIILICDSSSRTGAHSDINKSSAAKLLSEKGFTNVYHIYGGFRGNKAGGWNNGWVDYFPSE